MANINDYIDWRGDVPFSLAPFNEVDNLILAELVYTDFGGIVPKGFGKTITIAKAREKFFAKYTEKELMDKLSTIKIAPFLMQHMEGSVRFDNIKLCGYVNEISNEDQVQFSVITCILPDDTVYVAFRGTDNSLIGWKEDFNMSFVYETPGQLSAAKYLNDHFQEETRSIRVGGHSKGGNFSVFASAFCDKKIQNKIIAVYSNDGPGFRKEVLDAPGYKRILPKVVSILPEDSLVGVLLGNEYNNRFVKSDKSGGVNQHNGFTWQVTKNGFEYVEGQGKGSLIMEDSLKLWLSDLDDDKRKKFVDLLFDALMASGANTTDDFVSNGLKSITESFKLFNDATEEDKKLFMEIFKKLASSIRVSATTRYKEQITANIKGFTNKLKELPKEAET